MKGWVLVITGASSGVGLACAREAAARGARVVLSSRNETELAYIAASLREQGCEAIHVAADVADCKAVERIGEVARAAYGGVDAWINCAGVGLVGDLLEEPIEDERRIFEVNYWGTVHGSRTAVALMRERGGAIVNVGSVLATRAAPLQGAFSAACHAVKAWTDALRLELEHDGVPIAVALIELSGIDTPFASHARVHGNTEVGLPSPVYTPEVAARAILRALDHPPRDLVVGGGALWMVWLEKLSPRFGDRLLERWPLRPARVQRRDDALDAPPEREGEVRGGIGGRVLRSSLRTAMSLHPLPAAAGAAALGAAALLVARR